jgi:hypothetical protein
VSRPPARPPAEPAATPGSTLGATVAWLARLQHRSGSWTDFLLAPGPSDAWVTAYTGTALALAANDHLLDPRSRTIAGRSADAAACWLLRCVGEDGGWGWTMTVRPDADSTAWAVRLLALRGWPVPAQALAFLTAHRDRDGYRTYRSEKLTGSWSTPTPEVTAAVLLARHATAALDRAGLAAAFQSLLAPSLAPDGQWHSIWWDTPPHPTAIVGAAYTCAGRPDLPTPPKLHLDPANPTGNAWELAARLWAAAAFATERPGECARLAARLLALRRGDGGWPGQARLRVPAQHTAREPQWSRDARGIFTTATALHALLAAGPVAACTRIGRARTSKTEKSNPRGTYDDVVSRVATAAGVDGGTALTAFRALTKDSLARPGVWPAAQLSNLAGGTPLEFSVGPSPALRLTTEVGDPLLPPHRRVRSSLRAIARAAAVLGLTERWRAVQPAVAVLADPDLPVPDGNRFWVWAGLDLAPGSGATLKTYLSLHAEDVPGWQARELAFLRSCGVPDASPAHAVIDRLRQDGWCHEAGLGLTPRGWGIKIYYELAGYRPPVVSEILSLCGLDPDPTGIAPEVPGVLRASLAAKRRAGIAIRIHPSTGRVDEVTVAAAFPVPMIGRTALTDRVRSWLGPSASPAHDAAVAAILPTWRTTPDPPPAAKLHSLFTRTRSPRGDETKIYLRPWAGA